MDRPAFHRSGRRRGPDDCTEPPLTEEIDVDNDRRCEAGCNAEGDLKRHDGNKEEAHRSVDQHPSNARSSAAEHMSRLPLSLILPLDISHSGRSNIGRAQVSGNTECFSTERVYKPVHDNLGVSGKESLGKDRTRALTVTCLRESLRRMRAARA